MHIHNMLDTFLHVAAKLDFAGPQKGAAAANYDIANFIATLLDFRF